MHICLVISEDIIWHTLITVYSCCSQSECGLSQIKYRYQNSLTQLTVQFQKRPFYFLLQHAQPKSDGTSCAWP